LLSKKTYVKKTSNSANLPTPSTNNVYWKIRSKHAYGRLSSYISGYVTLASLYFVLQTCSAPVFRSTIRILELGLFGSTIPTYTCRNNILDLKFNDFRFLQRFIYVSDQKDKHTFFRIILFTLICS